MQEFRMKYIVNLLFRVLDNGRGKKSIGVGRSLSILRHLNKKLDLLLC